MVVTEVVSLDDGTRLWSRNPDAQLNPASNTKLVTAAAALFWLVVSATMSTSCLGIGTPRWHMTHWKRVVSAADFPISPGILAFRSRTICIMTRAVFLVCLASDAMSLPGLPRPT